MVKESIFPVPNLSWTEEANLYLIWPIYELGHQICGWCSLSKWNWRPGQKRRYQHCHELSSPREIDIKGMFTLASVFEDFPRLSLQRVAVARPGGRKTRNPPGFSEKSWVFLDLKSPPGGTKSKAKNGNPCILSSEHHMQKFFWKSTSFFPLQHVLSRLIRILLQNL